MPAKAKAAPVAPDPSKPLEGKKEDFCLNVFGGDRPIDAYRKCYPNAGQGTCEVESCRMRAEPNVALRIEWLRKQVASKKILTVERKREKLYGIVEEEQKEQETRDIIAAIKVDNEMAGDNKPRELNVSGGVTLLDAVKAITHGDSKS